MDIDRLATTLDEDLTTVQGVLGETINLGLGHDLSIVPEKVDDSVRYCERCASIGYHSYLHEYHWLARCPFHSTPLKVIHAPYKATTVQVRRYEALARLMQAACSYWPRTGSQSFEPKEYEGFRWLSSWASRVTQAATQFSHKKIWSSDDDRIFPPANGYGDKIGRLHALEPIPDAMKPLFSDVQEGWGADIRYFPMEARQEFARIATVGVRQLFSFFKKVAAYSSQPYCFIHETDLCRQQIQARHPECRCAWGRETINFGRHHWVRVHSEEWPHWNLICPFSAASEKLELAIGHRFEALSRRHREEEQLQLVNLSRELAVWGFAGYTPNANVSPEGLLYAYPQVWPCMEWIGTPWLNAVFDCAAQFEVQAVYESLSGWLDSIEAGDNPGIYEESHPSIRLSETEEGLVLVKWRRQASP